MKCSVVQERDAAQLVTCEPRRITGREDDALVHDGPVEQAEDGVVFALKRKMFRNKFTMVRLALNAAERQSRITLRAWNLLGPNAAIAFPNNHSEPLGGLPLDLAVASAAGVETVEREFAARISPE